MTALDRAFAEHFGDMLCEHGFRVSDDRVYMRLMNGEVVHYLFPFKAVPDKRGDKAFTVRAGIMSIYAVSFGKDFLSRYVNDIFIWSYYADEKYDTDELQGFSYCKENEYEIFMSARGLTEKIILPLFNKVNELESYVDTCKKMFIDNIRYADEFSGDSLVLIKMNNREDFMDLLNEEYEKEKALIDSGISGNSYEKAYRLLYNGIIKTIPEPRDKVYSDPALYKKALETADKRAADNLGYLHSLGF